MPTIRSRCQIHLLPLPSADQVLSWLSPLVTGTGMSPEQLLSASGGGPLKALALLEGDGGEWRRQLQDGLRQLAEGRISASALAGQWRNAEVTLTFPWLLRRAHAFAPWR